MCSLCPGLTLVEWKLLAGKIDGFLLSAEGLRAANASHLRGDGDKIYLLYINSRASHTLVIRR